MGAGPVRRTAIEATPPAIAHLLAEHEAGQQKFAALRAAVAAAQAGKAPLATTVAEVGDVLDYLNGALELHIAKEEGPLFPRLKAALPPDDRLIDEMVAEHDLIRIKRAELWSVVIDALGEGHEELRSSVEKLRIVVAGAPTGTDAPAAWLAELAGAAHAVVQKAEVHFENEEELVFPLAPQLLDAGTLARVAVEMQEIDAVEARGGGDGA